MSYIQFCGNFYLLKLLVYWNILHQAAVSTTLNELDYNEAANLKVVDNNELEFNK